MKRWTKRIMALVLTMVMVGGCAIAEATVDPIIAYVNDEPLYQSDCDYMVNYYVDMFTSAGYDVTDQSVVDVIVQYAFSNAVGTLVLQQYMKREGYYLFTPDQMEAILADAQERYDAYVNYFASYYKTYMGNLIPTEDDSVYITYAKTYLIGIGVTLEKLQKDGKNAKAQAALMDDLGKDLTFSDAEIEAGYRSFVGEDMIRYASNIPAFEEAMSNGDLVFYHPGGYRTVQHIMLKVDDALLAAFDDTKAETKRDIIASVQATIDEIHQKLEAGESFESLIPRYSIDEENHPEGYDIHRNSVIWDEAIKNTVFGDSMKQPGDVSDPLVSAIGVHLFYYVEDTIGQALAYNDAVKKAVLNQLIYNEEEERLGKLLQQLTDEAKIEMVDKTAE